MDLWLALQNTSLPEGPFEPPMPLSEVKQETYNLPSLYEWITCVIDDEATCTRYTPSSPHQQLCWRWWEYVQIQFSMFINYRTLFWASLVTKHWKWQFTGQNNWMLTLKSICGAATQVRNQTWNCRTVIGTDVDFVNLLTSSHAWLSMSAWGEWTIQNNRCHLHMLPIIVLLHQTCHSSIHLKTLKLKTKIEIKP